MTTKAKNTLWVTTVRPREIDGETSIPSAIRYIDDRNVRIGTVALETRDPNQKTNLEFKIHLGDVTPGTVAGREKFETTIGKKTAYEICNDFVTNFLSHIERELPSISPDAPKIPAKIMVAEPLSFQVENHSKQWLANYRSNFRRMLSRYEEVDFLPEPFAVYQYYRYGLRVPRLLDLTKQIALILDFGGGTFDACVIESTKHGDVSMSGKHSKPLAAQSVPVGGFFINKRLALYLIKRGLEGRDRKLVDRYFRQYERVKQGTLSLEMLRHECQDFISNFERLERSVERYKVALTSSITSWGLDNEAYDKILVQIPNNPLKRGTWIDTELYAHQFRQIFVNQIWNDRLKDVIAGVIDIASEALDGRNITTTLISGGSSNIRWLEHLISKDFADLLSGAEPVPINHSFQEVVANGLAIECARRHYSGEHSSDTEFMAVTYNPVKLHLGSDGHDLVRNYQFRSVNDRIDMGDAKPGDLIPSAQSLRHFFGQHLMWRVKLNRPPKMFLEYIFRRPTKDANRVDSSEDNLEGVFNLEERSLPTRKKKFDSSILVDLELKSDGTTTPTFIYQTENKRGGIADNSEIGRPFYIDMTTQSERAKRQNKNYIGFDFGTSNSAVCTLNEAHIRLTQARATSAEWTSINDSLDALPYPVAISVRRYLSRPDNAVAAARDAFESGLALMAYVTAAEACALGCIGGVLKSFQHRAMSPLWALFKNCQYQLRRKGTFSKGLGRVLDNNAEVTLFHEAIKNFTENKHGMLADDAADWHKYVQLPLRVLVRGMDGLVFGRSLVSAPVPFDEGRHKGTFVVATDNQPFINTIKYVSDQSIDSSLSLLVHQKNGNTLSLSPFFLWFDRNRTGTHDCYMLDRFSSRDDGPTVKPCDREDVLLAEHLAPALKRAIESLLEETGESVRSELDIQFIEDDVGSGLSSVHAQ